jgi:hypothetical protein
MDSTQLRLTTLEADAMATINLSQSTNIDQ